MSNKPRIQEVARTKAGAATANIRWERWKETLLAILQRLTPRTLWLSSVALSVLITEVVVSLMDLLLKGEITPDYLLTGLIASLFAAAIVVFLLNLLFMILKENRIEHQRIEAERRIASIAFESQLGMIVTDANGVIMRINSAFTRLTGYSMEEVLGRTPAILKSGRHDPAFYQKLWGDIEKKGYWQGEVWNKRKDGQHYAEWLTISAVTALDGKVTHYVGAFSETTERTVAAEMLRKSADEISDLYHYAPCGYHSLDKDGVFQKINDTELAWLGYTRDEVIGKMKMTDLLTPASIQTFWGSFPKMMRRGEIQDLELEIVRKDGTILIGLINATAIYDDGGDFLMSRTTVVDITARKTAEAALRKSEERARLAINASNLALWDFNLQTGTVYLSEKWSSMLGGEYQPTYTTIDELSRQVPEEEHEMLKEAIFGAMKGLNSSSYQVTHRVRKLNGEYIWLLSEGHVVERGADGRAVRMIGTNRDITKRKRAGEKLRESEATLLAILNNSPYQAWLKDADGRYLKGNKRYADFMNLTDSDEIIGKTDFDLWPKELAEKYIADDFRVMATHEQKRFEETFWDGHRVRVIETFKTPIIDRKGAVLGTTGFALDITERKEVEQALLQQKDFIRQIIDSDPNMITVKDAEGNLLLVNQAMAVMHGMSPDDLIEQSRKGQFPAYEYLDIVLQADREVIEMQRKVELITRDVQNAQEHWFHIIKVPMKQPDGDVHVLGIAVDITEKKYAEKQRRELAAHIQTAREEEKASIARDIHDDLGGTLTALNMEVHWLSSEVSGGTDTVTILERIDAMTQLLDSAVLTTRRVISELHPNILDDLGLVAALEWQAGRFQKRTGIQCRVFTMRDKDCQFDLDRVQVINLFRIFQETLTNVARHSGATSVEVKFHQQREAVVMSIRDNGCGLPDEHTIASTSYGLRGMAERVKLIDGEIEFDSPPVGGLCVTVKLPTSDAQSVEA